MNQENYKEIAKIIKKNTAPKENQFDNLSIVGDYLIDNLAGYFEKENNKKLEKNMSKIYGKGESISIFNRKQFLKDCGVDE